MSSLELNNWDIFKDYINSFNNGDIITRKKLMEFMNNHGSSSTNTVDSYRSTISKLEIIQTKSSGEYIKICNIPAFLTSNMALEYRKNVNILKFRRMLKLKEIFN